MRHKQGDINQDTGMVFWSYDSDGRERWNDPMRHMFLCNRAALSRRRNYWKNPESRRRKLREYHHKNKAMKSAAFKKWASQNKPRIRADRLMRQYGITQEVYDQMFLAQNGLCAICQRPQHGKRSDGSPRVLCVDHCHKTRKVRKLLCTKCNAGIGQFEDDFDRITQAALYVKAHMQTQGLNQ